MQSADRGNLIINPIIYAEVSIGFAGVEVLEAALPSDFFQYEPLPGTLLSLQVRHFYNTANVEAIAAHPCQIFILVPTPLSWGFLC